MRIFTNIFIDLPDNDIHLSIVKLSTEKPTGVQNMQSCNAMHNNENINNKITRLIFCL